MSERGCICKGNWRKLVAETEPLIGKTFADSKGEQYVLFGLVHTEEDYYYGMNSASGGILLLSCVGSIEGHGFKERDDGGRK